MKDIFVADVGDGMCMAINTISNGTIQIDWGSQQGGKLAFERGLRIRPNIFILSHFHVDHYNGLLYASINPTNLRFGRFKIRKVYYPRIPDFEEKRKFMEYLFAMNLRVFGSDTGVMEYDFLKAISRINIVNFKYKPLSKGDIITLNSSVFEVLWPPAVIDDDKTLTVIRQALRDFKKALEEDEIMRELYDCVIV